MVKLGMTNGKGQFNFTLPPSWKDGLQADLNKMLSDVFSDFRSGFPAFAASPPAPTPLVDEALARLVHHPAIILIVGHRGAGKSVLAVRLQELLQHVAPAYAIGMPPKASRLLPSWYGLADDASTIPQNAVIYVPESYRLFHARSTQSAQGRAISDLVNLSRHRRHSLIFDVQNPAHLDRNIISEVDLVLIKEPGPFQMGFERAQFRGIMDTARATFAAVGTARKKRCVWVVAPTAGIHGQLMENLLPTFWSDSLSRLFGETAPGIGGSVKNKEDSPTDQRRTAAVKTATPRRGRKASADDKRARARQMKAAGHSYGEIAGILGISRSYAYQLVNGSSTNGHRP